MTVSHGTDTYNHVKLTKISACAYEVRNLRLKDTMEKLFVYLVRDPHAGINYEWRLAKGVSFESKHDYDVKMDRSWKAKKIIDGMNKDGVLVSVKEYGLTRNVYRADLIAQNPDLVETKSVSELLSILNEMAPAVGFTALDEWKKGKAVLVGRIMEAHGKLDGRKNRARRAQAA